MANQPDNAQDKSRFALIEEQIAAAWKEESTFERSIEQRASGEFFSFYDGPPFANGQPHFGHILASSIKDAVLRYKTMRGYYVPRRNGWDCHGLPVEFSIEKELELSGKKQILEYGIDKFNAACRASIFKYKGDFERQLQRLGRWSEYDNYYATVDTTYTESTWWVLKQIHDKSLLYRGYKSAPYCPRCETPLSNFEVNEGYKDDVPDPSLFITFPLVDDDRKLLAWTTTPWSLGGNTAVAVNPKEMYVTVKADRDGTTEKFILAKKRLEILDESYEILEEMPGSDLVGKRYEPIYTLDAAIYPQVADDNIYKVWPASFASVEDGTGLVHVAPATGVDDLALSEEFGIPIIHVVDTSGHLLGGFGFEDVAGKFFKGADRHIIEHLTEKGRVFAAETFTHTYPFCWRCESPLLYYAITSWYVRVSAIHDELIASAEEINWVPGNIKKGRFGRWLEGARDWSISRNRYWGAPLPIWINEADENDYVVVGSIAELKELAGPDIKVDDLHRPFIDDITFERDGKTYRRVEEVLDCWFESGSMSVAQQHYPFENEAVFDKTFPADFIIEGLDQTRLWFYVQHVVATILFNRPAYKNVIVNGMIMAADGQKLSKRLKNYPPVEEVFNVEGADTLRLYLLSNTQASETADYMRFNRDAMRDIQRNILGTLDNSLRFFKTYADIDGFVAKGLARPDSAAVLDQWILARLDETIAKATASADDFKVAHAIEPVFGLIDDMSNWYIRRSRRRFWKSEDDSDKQAAYATLWYVLARIAQLLAPWAPFYSDYLWRELSDGVAAMPASVHLSDWPPVEEFDDTVISNMARTREYINEALSQRAEAKIKVRQPLAGVVVPELPEFLYAIVQEEVNVKQVTEGTKVQIDTQITPELEREGIMRDLVRHIQNARKRADLEVDDRISLAVRTDDPTTQHAIEEHLDTIKTETLAGAYSEQVPESTPSVKINGVVVQIAVKKI